MSALLHLDHSPFLKWKLFCYSGKSTHLCWGNLAQTAAEGEVQEANVRAKHLEKQLLEQRKALAAKEKEAGLLAQELKRERATVDACQQR